MINRHLQFPHVSPVLILLGSQAPTSQVKYVVWTGYPVAYWLRSTGFITYWQEEVLCYTALEA